MKEIVGESEAIVVKTVCCVKDTIKRGKTEVTDRKGDHILKSTSDKTGKEFLKINKKEIND